MFKIIAKMKCIWFDSTFYSKVEVCLKKGCFFFNYKAFLFVEIVFTNNKNCHVQLSGLYDWRSCQIYTARFIPGDSIVAS